jgi:hypothetical protein
MWALRLTSPAPGKVGSAVMIPWWWTMIKVGTREETFANGLEGLFNTAAQPHLAIEKQGRLDHCAMGRINGAAPRIKLQRVADNQRSNLFLLSQPSKSKLTLDSHVTPCTG